MNFEQKQRLLILLSSFTLTIINNINPTKKEVLDEIQNNNWVNFSPHQLQLKNNRNELVWRNEFAFTKKHLMDEGCIVNKRNDWSITTKGRDELKKLCQIAFNTGNFNLISTNCINYAQQIYPKI